MVAGRTGLMARKLKTYVTSVGFFDLAIAAPSMKAALEAWGSNTNLFHQGFAKEVTAGPVVEATLANPGVVLKRPVGTNKPFREDAPLPESLREASDTAPKRRARPERSSAKTDQKAARKAALAYEREQEKRDAARRKEEAAAEKARKRRQQAIDKAQAALDAAEQEHTRKADAIETARAEIEAKQQAEETRWREQKDKLEKALHRARSSR